MRAPAIGVDIGGTFTKFVVLDADNRVQARHRIMTDDTPASRLPQDVAREIARLEAGTGLASTIGIACPGLVNPDGDAVYWMKGRLDVLEGLDWRRALGRAAPVRVINDAQAALAGESAIGAGRGCRNVVMLTIGTGVGGAIMCDGRVIAGSLGRAGHLGHISV
jgi:glucokinase